MSQTHTMHGSPPRRPLVGWLAFASMAAFLTPTQAATYSLADDFSYTDNRTNSTWSYRMDDPVNHPPAFPLLTSTNRDANALWGSEFQTPPMMWSEASGYWGIGKNMTGREQSSAKNGTRWAPGEIIFHPKAGASPAGLVVGWTAPSSMVIDIHYVFGCGAQQGNGIGYQIIHRSGGVDAEIVSLNNLGSSLTNELTGVIVAKGDQFFFRFNTCGDPSGDISRAAIEISGRPSAEAPAMAAQPAGGTLTAGSDFTFSVPATGARSFQWRKDGQLIAGATAATYRIRGVKTADAGTYSVLADAVPSVNALLNVTPRKHLPDRYSSLVPRRQVFSPTLAEQEKELKTNDQMLRFTKSRQRLAADPYRPAYHFVNPECMMNDPNGLCFWQGRWHLFYQAFPPDEFPKDIVARRIHWGHAVSDDLVHWRDLPYAISPGIENQCASGGTVAEENQVVAFYPGHNAGMMVAIAKDPLLLNWNKIEGNPVIPNPHNSSTLEAPFGDSSIWKEGNTYFGLMGVPKLGCLVSSTNLVDWKVRNGRFLEGSPFPTDDGSCPTFLPIADKYILLLFSHIRGGQYLLGDYDRPNAKFTPYEHGRFNHGNVAPGGVHAPSAAPDGKGGVINILDINDGKPNDDWDQLMSLAQRLTLGPDKRLRIEPVDAVASVRGSHQQVGETVLPANKEIVLEAIKGNTLELEAEIDPQTSRWVQLSVLRSPDAEEHTSITFHNYDRKLSTGRNLPWYYARSVVCLDGSRSSNLPDVLFRPPEMVVLERGGEPLKLRVFVDHSVVEVFVNGRQYLAMRVYPGRKDSVGVSVRAQGQEAVLKKLDAWQMKPIWP